MDKARLVGGVHKGYSVREFRVEHEISQRSGNPERIQLPGPVIVVEYDPRWPVLYEEERKRVVGAAGRRILAVEHIGSTAVPGLAAKPIIDMMAGVHESSEADECLPVLARIGYTHVEPEPGNQEWFYCCGKGPHSIGYHLHLVKYKSSHWNKHLLFRDYLRNHRGVARQYEELKMRLAEEFGSDRETYTQSKSAFIESVIRRTGEDENSHS